MMPWFIWNGKSSASYGLWISKLPKVTRPQERVTQLSVPGRAGDLTIIEGNDVYEAYKKDIVVTCVNEAITPSLMNWLRGEGSLIISTEDQYVYHGRIAAEVSFTRVGNSLSQATISFWVQPFKYARNAEEISVTGDTVIVNPGNAIAKPKLTVQKHGDTTIAIGDTSMRFPHMPEMLVIDCDAEIITTTAIEYSAGRYYYRGDFTLYSQGQGYDTGIYRFIEEGIGANIRWEYVGEYITDFEYAWPGDWEGEFLRFIPGGNPLTLITNSPSDEPIIIEPRWRWV